MNIPYRDCARTALLGFQLPLATWHSSIMSAYLVESLVKIQMGKYCLENVCKFNRNLTPRLVETDNKEN